MPNDKDATQKDAIEVDDKVGYKRLDFAFGSCRMRKQQKKRKQFK
jgi:hypothetical protein